ncbi:ABC transporter ATP-binding/permease protein [Mycobacterium sp. THAF192]|nr:ABC transporter ATP-binding/permease protein [Mycobacterium sp. THAF192]
MLVLAIMVSIVFAGGLIPVTNRLGLEQASWMLPARWGFAASAATADLRYVAPFVPADEDLWSHTAQGWLLNIGVLVSLGAAATVFLLWRLRLKPLVRRHFSVDRFRPPTSASPSIKHAPRNPESSGRLSGSEASGTQLQPVQPA